MMPIQFGPTKIGGMQYNGVTIGEAMYNGQIVYQSKILIPFSYDFGFNDLPNIWWAPISGYDYRTHASAPRPPTWTFNGMLVAPDNTHPAYLGHLLNRKCDGDLAATITFGDAVNTLAYPTSLILKSNFDQSEKLEVAFGSNGIAVNHITGSQTNQLWSSTQGIGTWQQRHVSLSGNYLEIYNGNTRLTVLNLVGYIPDFHEKDWGYFGFGAMSTSGQWSSRIDRVQFSGMTSYEEEPVARASTRRITLARNTWTEIAAIHVNTAIRAERIGAYTSWPNISGVQLRIMVNGTRRVLTSSDSTAINGLNIGANQWVLLQAYTSNSSSSNRRVTEGRLEITVP